MDPGCNLWCSGCKEEFNLTDREPKQLNCSHTICLRCAQGMVEESELSTIKCPTCHNGQRVATGNCRQLLQSFRVVQMMQKTLKKRNEHQSLMTKNSLQTYAAEVRNSIRLLRNRLDAHDKERRDLESQAVRARANIEQAVEQAEARLRRRAASLYDQLDWLVEGYKSKPAQVLIDKIQKAEDLDRRIQRALSFSHVGDFELEYITTSVPSVVAQQNTAVGDLPAMEGLSVSCDMTHLVKSIAEFGSVKLKPGGLQSALMRSLRTVADSSEVGR